MTVPAFSYDDLMALNPCTESMRRVVKLMGGAKKWDGNKISAAQARKAGATFDDIVWAASALSRTDKDVERRLRLWMADCAAHVLHIFEKEFPDDLRPRSAIIASRQFARGEIEAAYADAAETAYADAADAAKAAYAKAAYANAAFAAAFAAANAAANAADASAGASDAADAAMTAERNWQFDCLVEWLSENEPKDYPLPSRPKKRRAA